MGGIVKNGSTRLLACAILIGKEFCHAVVTSGNAAGWIGNRQTEIVAAIQRALIEGIRIPETDRCVRILEYPAGTFFAPPDRGPRYSVLEISMFAGRSRDAKGRLYAALQREMSAFGLAEGDLKVIVHDVPFDNWGLRGRPADPATLTFKVDV